MAGVVGHRVLFGAAEPPNEHPGLIPCPDWAGTLEVIRPTLGD
jgi:hypothetical protein